MLPKYSSKVCNMIYKCYLFLVDEDYFREVNKKISDFTIKIRKNVRKYKINSFLFEEQIETYWY